MSTGIVSQTSRAFRGSRATSVYVATYDAEGNLTKVDGGATASYTFNALNQRVRIDFPSDSSASEEFIFDPWGRHTSSHDVVNDWGWARWIYWGASSTRVAVNIDTQTYFDHPD